jgi:hypothetical protein
VICIGAVMPVEISLPMLASRVSRSQRSILAMFGRRYKTALSIL